MSQPIFDRRMFSPTDFRLVFFFYNNKNILYYSKVREIASSYRPKSLIEQAPGCQVMSWPNSNSCSMTNEKDCLNNLASIIVLNWAPFLHGYNYIVYISLSSSVLFNELYKYHCHSTGNHNASIHKSFSFFISLPLSLSLSE